jgi:methylenetetrahydrofolate--tRNA-(uracil-5-)-methyltransferase
MRLLGCMVLECADAARVPGGSALTVDRDIFSVAVHERVTSHPRITVERGEVAELPSPGIVATGPLTSSKLAETIRRRLGLDALAFYDAIAPIVAHDSIDYDVVFRASRYGKETMEGESEGAYLNCPMSREQYEAFIDALTAADQATAHEFDAVRTSRDACPPRRWRGRGRESLRFGPMKPVGLVDPRTRARGVRRRPASHGGRAGRMWNLVGFQTRLRYPEQQRVFRMIPRPRERRSSSASGSIHRNSYLNAPAALLPHLALRDDPACCFAGQLTGVEGYTESTATGPPRRRQPVALLAGEEPVLPPPTTMLGALYRYMREADPRHFQPMNANFGLVDELGQRVKDKRVKKERSPSARSRR